MKLRMPVIAHAVARTGTCQVINVLKALGINVRDSFVGFGSNVRPWKRTLMWVCIVLNSVGFALLAHRTGHPLWLLFPVVSTMTALEYLNNTAGQSRPRKARRSKP